MGSTAAEQAGALTEKHLRMNLAEWRRDIMVRLCKYSSDNFQERKQMTREQAITDGGQVGEWAWLGMAWLE